MSRKIIRFKGLFELTGLSRTQITRLETAGKFPQRIALGPATNSPVAWFEDEVIKWTDDRPRKTLKRPE